MAAVAGSAASSMARERLVLERKAWKKDHPYGMVAKPMKTASGGTDWMNWEAKIPGPPKTIWEGAQFTLKVEFDTEYPTKPPKVSFVPPLFHPNVYPSGKVCLSILDDKGWAPGINMKSILQGVQTLLSTPNLDDPANSGAHTLAKFEPKKYEAKVKEIVKELSVK